MAGESGGVCCGHLTDLPLKMKEGGAIIKAPVQIKDLPTRLTENHKITAGSRRRRQGPAVSSAGRLISFLISLSQQKPT